MDPARKAGDNDFIFFQISCKDDLNGSDFSLDRIRPKFQKIMQFRKLWRKIIILPNKSLEERRMVRELIEYFCCCQSIVIE